MVVTTSARAWAASAPVPWSSSSRWVNSYDQYLQDGDDCGDEDDHDDGDDEKGGKMKSP